MAKQQQELTKAEPTSVALPDYLKDYQGTGAGVSREASDTIVPLIVVLHKLSPQVDQSSDKYVPGARPGDIWLRSATVDPIIKGEVGFDWQQCYFSKDWIEWVPRDRGGGLVARWSNKVVSGQDVPDCPGATLKPGNKFVWVRDGNEISQNRNHAGFVLGHGPVALPYVIPFKGAGHMVSRQFTSNVIDWQKRHLIRGKLPDAWLVKWHVGTKAKKNAKGDWHDLMFDPQPVPGFLPEDQVSAGLAMYKGFTAGELSIGAEEAAPPEDIDKI